MRTLTVCAYCARANVWPDEKNCWSCGAPVQPPEPKKFIGEPGMVVEYNPRWNPLYWWLD